MGSRSETRASAVGELEVRGWRLESRIWKLEVRDWLMEGRLNPSLTYRYYRRGLFYFLTSSLFVLLLFVSFLHGANAQSLENYQQLATENNPGLQAKYKDFEASMQEVTQAKAWQDPTFSVSALGQMTQTRTGQQMAILSLSQMLPWFGTLKAQGDISALMAEAKYQAYLESRNQLCYEVAKSYYALYELKKWISIEQENIQILNSYKAIATANFQNGKGSMVDVLRVDIMLKEAMSNLSILSQKKKPLQTRFNALLNTTDDEEISIVDSLAVTKLQTQNRKDSLLVNNPLINEIALKMQASESSQTLAEKQGMPKVGVGFQYIIVAPRTDLPQGQTGADIPQNGQDAFMPMLTMSIPIFRGKYKAAQKEAELKKDAYTLQKEEVLNNLISSYDMVWFEIQKQTELIQLYDAQIKTSKQSLNLLLSAYSNSEKDFEEVLEMQQQILKYQKMNTSVLVQYHIALAQLDYLTATPSVDANEIKPSQWIAKSRVMNSSM